MRLKDRVEEKIKRTKLGKRILEEYDFKTTVFALCSLVINVAFAVINGVGAFLYSSVWFGSLAGYYFALIIFRAVVIIADRRCSTKFKEDEKRYNLAQTKIHLVSGAFLVAVQIAMCVAVTQLVLSKSEKSGMIMAIATATYTFIKISMAIYNLVKAQMRGGPVAQSLRNLNLASAFMSLVSLTVLLVTTFGEGEDASFIITMKALVGFAACVAVLAMASVMIIRSAKTLKGVRENTISE